MGRHFLLNISVDALQVQVSNSLSMRLEKPHRIATPVSVMPCIKTERYASRISFVEELLNLILIFDMRLRMRMIGES